jgi:hypothetical protein
VRLHSSLSKYLLPGPCLKKNLVCGPMLRTAVRGLQYLFIIIYVSLK